MAPFLASCRPAVLQSRLDTLPHLVPFIHPLAIRATDGDTMADQATQQSDPAKREGKKPVATVSEIVDLNEKSVMDDPQEDIQHGIAHAVNELEQHVNDLDDSWETESMLADMLDGLAEDDHANGMFESCTPHPLQSVACPAVESSQSPSPAKCEVQLEALSSHQTN